jgi:non-ribosomal peptide synthetase component F
VEELATKRSLTHSPVFQTTFALERVSGDAGDGRLSLGELELARFGPGEAVAKFDLDLAVEDGPGALAGAVVYRAALFEAATIARMAGHLETLLEAMAADPSRRVSGVSLLRDAERAQVLEAGSASTAGLVGACVHELITEQAARTPAAAALVSAGRTITFAELERGSGRIARRLRALGVGPETVVAVLMRHSPDVVAALLGVLEAGGVYLPLDPEAPAERLGYVLRDARAALVLAQPGLEARLPPGGPAVLVLDPVWAAPAAGEEPAPRPRVAPESAAYLIYTSGSTGAPKGVVVPHEAAASHLREVARAYGHTPADRVLAFASLTFDQSVEDLLAPLVVGASVVARDPTPWTPGELAERVRTLGITAMNLPTAYWMQLVRDRPAASALRECLRLMIVGGEALTSAAVLAWDALPGGPVRLVNGYGPTETVVTATLFEVPPAAPRSGARGCRSGSRWEGVPRTCWTAPGSRCRSECPGSCASGGWRWPGGTSACRG